MTSKNFHMATFTRMCKARGIDEQTIDFEAEWDSSLTAKENFARLKEILERMKPPEERRHELEEKYDEQFDEHKLEYIEAVSGEALSEIKGNEAPELDKHYVKLCGYVDALLKGDNNSLFVVGSCGTGKSFNILKKLRDECIEFRYISGNITPLELYHELYHNMDRVVVLDDTVALLENKQAMALLYEAMWSAEGERTVEWRSTSSKLDAPKKFCFTGKIIFLMNSIPTDNVMVRTLMSRCLAYELNFSYHEVLEIMFEMCKVLTAKNTVEENFEVAEWLRENTDVNTRNFNLRTFIKVRDLKNSNENWKELAEELWELRRT